jgi:Nitrogenase component 1 type Oxidoreductase
MARPDPYDVAGLLRRLTHRLTAALTPMAGHRWRCQRVLPRIDGTASLAISGPLGDSTYDWVAPPPPSRSAQANKATWHWGQLQTPPDPGDPRVARQVNRLLSSTLSVTLAHPDFSVLRWCNRHLFALQFDDAVVDVLLADRLAPGRSRWFDHVFREASQDQADHFQLVFSGPQGDLRLTVGLPGTILSDSELLFEHRLFHLWLTADPRPPQVRGLVPSQVERFGGFLLSRGVHPSMRPRGDARFPPTGPGATTSTPATSWRGAPVSTSRWGNPLQWHQFFSDFEISRSGLSNVQFDEPVAYVLHGERECVTVEPQIRPRTHTYARMPFRQEVPRNPSPESGGREFLSLITERETVLGGDDSLENALDRASRDPHTKLICVNNTCLPKMVGDDLDSLVSRLSARTDKPILNLNTDLSSPDASYRHMLAQAEQAAGHTPDTPPVPPGAVSFLGFVPGPYRPELLHLLESLGVVAANFLVPALNVGAVSRYRAGCAQVIYPRDTWLRLHAELFGDLDTPVLDVPAPYGLRDTRRWLEVISAATRHPDAFGEQWPEMAAAELRRFDALRDQVGDRRVGAVVTPASAPRLYEAERLYGVRLLPLLEELGFGLDVLMLGPDADPDANPDAEMGEAEDGLRDCLEDPTRLAITHFHSPASLARSLADAPCHLVYSEVACDHRLSQAGKTGFGLDLFEMGLAGAVRSLERLLTLDRWPFYRRYARWLPGASPLTAKREESDHE